MPEGRQSSREVVELQRRCYNQGTIFGCFRDIMRLGRWLRSGWDLRRVSGELHLRKDGYSFAAYSRKNSLYTQGVISKVTSISEAAVEPEAQSISVIRLTSLTNLTPGWNEFHEDL